MVPGRSNFEARKGCGDPETLLFRVQRGMMGEAEPKRRGGNLRILNNDLHSSAGRTKRCSQALMKFPDPVSRQSQGSFLMRHIGLEAIVKL